MSRRRWIVIGALVAIVAAGGALWWRLVRPPVAMLVGMRAVDADSAIGIWLGKDTEWIARIDADGRLVWWRELAGRLESTDVVPGLAIADGVVTLHYARGGTHAIAAFGYDDGHLMWDTMLAEPSDQSLYLAHDLPAQIVGGRVFEWIYKFPARLYVLDLHDGRVLAQIDGGSPNSQDAVILGDRVIVRSDLWQVGVIDLATKRYVDIDAGPGCVVGDDYITVAYDNHTTRTGALVVWPHGEPAARRDLVPHFQPVPGLDRWALAGCGRHGDHLVLSLGRMDEASKQLAYVVITDLHGTVEHVIALPELVEWHVIHSPLRGTLPRFVVQPSKLGLYAIDLETASVAWRGDSPGLEATPEAFGTADRWFVSLPFLDRGTLAVFDGATGKLVAGLMGYAATPGVVHATALQAQIGGDALWLWREFSEVRLDAAPVGTFDIHTLQSRTTRDVEVEDSTAGLLRALHITPL